VKRGSRAEVTSDSTNTSSRRQSGGRLRVAERALDLGANCLLASSAVFLFRVLIFDFGASCEGVRMMWYRRASVGGLGCVRLSKAG